MLSLPPLVEPLPALSAAEAARTARHTSLAALGEIGQRRLAAAHVAVIGAGGLGSPIVLALAAAGIGTLTVIDDDTVEASNLQRQVMHRLRDVDALKVDSAARVAADLAPETRVTAVARRLDAANATELLRGAHLVVDGSDTFDTREAVAAACETLGLPLVWGTVQAFDAQVTVFWSNPPAGAPVVRLADLYPPASAGDVPTCAQVGVLGALCLQVGSLMATEAIKLIAGIGEPLLGRVLVIDSLRARQIEVPLRGTDAGASAPDGPTAAASAITYISPRELADRLTGGTAPTLLDVREDDEVASGVIPGSIHLRLAEVLDAPHKVAGPVVVVCKAGVRARRAAEELVAAGVEATVLAGGIDAWHETLAELPA
jgi:sulfur-carrier protein adenylyltransferase/sulfurtransferase